MPLGEVPDHPLLTALNGECEVRVESLIELGENLVEVFFAYLNENRELDFGQGYIDTLVAEDSSLLWFPGYSGTPRIQIVPQYLLIPVTDLLGWTLCSAYPKMDLAAYHLHFIHLSLEGSSPYEEEPRA